MKPRDDIVTHDYSGRKNARPTHRSPDPLKPQHGEMQESPGVDPFVPRKMEHQSNLFFGLASLLAMFATSLLLLIASLLLLVRHLFLVAMHLFLVAFFRHTTSVTVGSRHISTNNSNAKLKLIANIVTTSKAPVTTSVALVPKQR